jgi:hypothetical protein
MLFVIHSLLVSWLVDISRTDLKILSLLQTLPMAIQAEHEEVLLFIENNQLMGKGLGYIDIHLLCVLIRNNQITIR